MNKLRKEITYGIVEKIHETEIYVGFLLHERDELLFLGAETVILYNLLRFQIATQRMKINLLYLILKIIA